MKRFILTVVVGCLLGTFPSGCSSHDEAQLAGVEGVVLLDGKPLPAGLVVTTPERGRGAQGTIEPNGQFSLSTRGLGNGASVGATPSRRGRL